MASSESNKKSNVLESNQDLISSLPTDLIDEILKRLPVSMVAKTSALSRKWRRNWLSLKYFVFDKSFWEEHKSNTNFDWKRINEIIGSILLYHNDPVHEFYLHVPNDLDHEFYLNISQWLSFLSRAAIKKISLVNLAKADSLPVMPSHIFACNELVHLKIVNYALNLNAPSDCIGFAYLRNLELLSVEFKHDVFRSLITSCPRLTHLRLKDCIGITNLVFDHVPILKILSIQGSFASLAFRNTFHLKRISLSLSPMENTTYLETVSAILALALPPVELQFLRFDGLLCKVTPSKNVLQHKFDYNNNFKLRHLLKAKITGITGSSLELKLVEYIAGISVKLKKFMFKCAKLDPSSELKVLRELLQLPRASKRAKLVCLAQ
ncbi:F-box/FBD/LRR-repeat protein At1g13570-like [Chenopodium quinoa]|uniref:F-box/FBD/LRR-repeat protein At1g13570-like n=1 Tax=Chenopodium quinoa TaxID=63459 RepID=UPI000B78E70A|nr:F-box/FBD/LRR-repeat protein At1g13570-like [Chenopodium quinoa]